MPENKNNREPINNPAAGHRERMRRRFAESYTLYNFTDEEVLEMLLFYVLPKQDTALIAKELIAAFGSLSGVFDAPIGSLESISGIGNYSALYFKFLKAVISKYRSSKYKPFPVIDNDFDLGLFCASLVGSEPDEKFLIITVDAMRRMTNMKVLKAGTNIRLSVNMREIMSFIIQNDAKHIVIAHNHPTGVVMPSEDDRQFTTRLQAALEVLEIGLIDHFVVYESKYYSFMENRLL